jgi:hypothetical protein
VSHTAFIGFPIAATATGDVADKLRSWNTSALIWTTTPWTLAANVAISVHPDLQYSVVKVDLSPCCHSPMVVEEVRFRHGLRLNCSLNTMTGRIWYLAIACRSSDVSMDCNIKLTRLPTSVLPKTQRLKSLACFLDPSCLEFRSVIQLTTVVRPSCVEPMLRMTLAPGTCVGVARSLALYPRGGCTAVAGLFTQLQAMAWRITTCVAAIQA